MRVILPSAHLSATRLLLVLRKKEKNMRNDRVGWFADC